MPDRYLIKIKTRMTTTMNHTCFKFKEESPSQPCFFKSMNALKKLLLSDYLVEVATLVSEDDEDDEDDAAEVEASDEAFFLALSRLSFSKSLLLTSGASVS